MHPMLNTAVKAARSAGKLILRYLNRLDRLEVVEKAVNDFVSEVDLAAEQEIIRTIHAAYPDHAILAEESGSHSGNNDYEWVIDPLDGTTNFLHGYPVFAVSIALRRGNRLEQAVVFDPLRDELFTASQGRGAHLNDRRIRVSKVHRLPQALIGTGFPFKTLEHLDQWLQDFRALLPRTSGIRRAGSAALDLAHVACGRFDGFWEMGLSPWDLAAGCLLVLEAGGLVSDLDSHNDYFKTGNVVAGNPEIHAALLAVIKRQHG